VIDRDAEAAFVAPGALTVIRLRAAYRNAAFNAEHAEHTTIAPTAHEVAMALRDMGVEASTGDVREVAFIAGLRLADSLVDVTRRVRLVPPTIRWPGDT
jgi:hypothetical protein